MRTSGTRAYLNHTPVPKMPPGLVALMEGMAKEVLRENPTDIYEFCAAHMKKLLEIRDGFAKEQNTPLTVKQANIQYQHEIKPRYDAEGKIALLNNHGDKENLIPDEQVKQSDEINLLQSNVINPVRRELDLMEASEIEITEEFINSENVEKCAHGEISEYDNLIAADENNEAHYIDLPNSFEVKLPTEETSNVGTTNLPESTLEINSTFNTDKLHEIKLPEENQSNILNYSKTTKEENIQAPASNEMDISEIDNEICESKLQEELHMTRNDDITGGDDLSNDHPQLAEDNLKNATDQNISVSHNFNELNTMNEEIMNPITDNNRASVAEMESTEEKQIPPVFEDTSKEEKDCEVKVPTEENEYKNENHCAIEKQDSIPSEVKEELDDIDISKEEVTLQTDFEKDYFVKNETNEHIDSNDKDNSNNIHTTNKNNSVCDNADAFDTTQDLEDNNLDTNLHLKKDLEDTILFENNDYDNAVQVETDNSRTNDNKDQLILAQNTEDTVEHTTQKIKDIGFIDSNELSYEHDVIVDKSESIDNSRTGWESTNESSTMDLETAAITIQKVFRSFLYKSRGSTFEDMGNDEIVLNDKELDKYANQNTEKRPLGITRMDSVLQTVNEEKSLSLSTDDSSTLSSAATIIQAHVRGFLLRNKINSSKTLSTNSVINSDSNPVIVSNDGEHQGKNKTVLNIHIVREEGNKSFNRDETVINSVDLSLDCSPPTSINLHPLGYDKSEPRKQLKREDAFQSVSPPSNNSGKVSEDIDSVKEIIVNDKINNIELNNSLTENTLESEESTNTAVTSNTLQQHDTEKPLTQMGSDESDVVTPFVDQNADSDVCDTQNTSKLVHSGEFHDVVIPTKVTRSDTSVARGE